MTTANKSAAQRLLGDSYTATWKRVGKTWAVRIESDAITADGNTTTLAEGRPVDDLILQLVNVRKRDGSVSIVRVDDTIQYAPGYVVVAVTDTTPKPASSATPAKRSRPTNRREYRGNRNGWECPVCGEEHSWSDKTCWECGYGR